MKATKKIVSVICVMMIALSALAFTGCGKDKNSIVGEWVYKSNDSEYVYIFNEDGTGCYSAWGINTDLTYEIDGENISISYSGNAFPSKYGYKINKKELTLKDSYGIEVIYTRK